MVSHCSQYFMYFNLFNPHKKSMSLVFSYEFHSLDMETQTQKPAHSHRKQWFQPWESGFRAGLINTTINQRSFSQKLKILYRKIPGIFAGTRLVWQVTWAALQHEDNGLTSWGHRFKYSQFLKPVTLAQVHTPALELTGGQVHWGTG